MSYASGQKQHPTTNKSPKIPILEIHPHSSGQGWKSGPQGRVNDEVKNNQAAERRQIIAQGFSPGYAGKWNQVPEGRHKQSQEKFVLDRTFALIEGHPTVLFVPAESKAWHPPAIFSE